MNNWQHIMKYVQDNASEIEHWSDHRIAQILVRDFGFATEDAVECVNRIRYVEKHVVSKTDAVRRLAIAHDMEVNEILIQESVEANDYVGLPIVEDD